MPPAELTVDVARSILAAQPFSELIGAVLTEFGDGAATLQLDIGPQHRQQFGLVHGGVHAYLADNVITFAAGSVLGASVLTGGFTITYVKGARDGTLVARATVAHRDRRQAVCTAEIHLVGPDGARTLCALAQGTVLATG